MHPPSFFHRGPIAALVVLASIGAVPSRAEEAQPLPTCQPTVAVPPPEPPARPGDLLAERPPNAPITQGPLPPERPANLPRAVIEAPSPGSAPSPAAPPDRPSDAPSPLELTVAPSSANRPTCTPNLVAPLPPERPGELSPSPTAAGDAHLPPARPPELTAPSAPTEDAPLPPVRPPDLSGDAALTATPPEDTACLGRLESLGVKFTKLAPIVNGQCSVAHPLSVTALGNGITIGGSATMVCPLAEGLARWTAEARQIAETELGEPLTGLTLGGTYFCRGQNHGAEAQLSEHAFANAVDVMGFAFAKRAPVAVGKLEDGSKEAGFLATVRTKACERFSTVLGPGTDEAHANHLHLDERDRKADRRLCQ